MLERIKMESMASWEGQDRRHGLEGHTHPRREAVVHLHPRGQRRVLILRAGRGVAA